MLKQLLNNCNEDARVLIEGQMIIYTEDSLCKKNQNAPKETLRLFQYQSLP